jgi:hydroxyethylthiazole kinase-like sugar kinase family protein
MNWLSWLRPKKSRMTAESAFGLISFCGRQLLMLVSNNGHALLDQTLGAGQAHAALVGEQVRPRTDAAAAQVVDVVDRALALAQVDQVADGGNQIRHLPARLPSRQ